jgi:hypothetical protein
MNSSNSLQIFACCMNIFACYVNVLLHCVCDDLKFDNKFEVPVMYSTAIPEPLLRYT